MLTFLVALLYYLCLALVGGLVCMIAFTSRHHSPLHSRLRRTFFLIALCLLLWQVTLFVSAHAIFSVVQLYMGRANFAVIALAVYLALRFVQQLAQSELPRWLLWLLASETWLLIVITLLTPFISEEEWIAPGTNTAMTRFGILFPFYLAHILIYILSALWLSFRERLRAELAETRGQLMLIGSGILATSSVALITNALLPYAFGDFRFCNAGTLTTLFFALAVAYAIFIHGLFDLQIVVRKTLIYGILLAFVLGGYSSIAFLLTQYLTDGADKITQFGVLFIAFSVDPLRRFLEKKTDRLLFNRN